LINFFLLFILCAFPIFKVICFFGKLLFHLIHRIVFWLGIIIENWHFVLNKLTQWLSRFVNFHILCLKKIWFRVLHFICLKNIFLRVRSRSSTSFNWRGATDSSALNSIELTCSQKPDQFFFDWLNWIS